MSDTRKKFEELFSEEDTRWVFGVPPLRFYAVDLGEVYLLNTPQNALKLHGFLDDAADPMLGSTLVHCGGTTVMARNLDPDAWMKALGHDPQQGVSAEDLRWALGEAGYSRADHPLVAVRLLAEEYSCLVEEVRDGVLRHLPAGYDPCGGNGFVDAIEEVARLAAVGLAALAPGVKVSSEDAEHALEKYALRQEIGELQAKVAGMTTELARLQGADTAFGEILLVCSGAPRGAWGPAAQAMDKLLRAVEAPDTHLGWRAREALSALQAVGRNIQEKKGGPR